MCIRKNSKKHLIDVEILIGTTELLSSVHHNVIGIGQIINVCMLKKTSYN